MKRTLSLILSLLLLLSATACATPTGKPSTNPPQGNLTVDGVTFLPSEQVTNYVRIEFEGFGTVLAELSPKDAPLTVANFQSLVAKGFYNGLTIHRVEPGFVIQGGDPKGNGLGGSDLAIKGEFAANGVVNNLSHRRGVLSMARKGNDYNSATSQFFVCLDTETCVYSLDGKYAAFGWVVSGMDVIDRIAGVKVSISDGIRVPNEKIVISSMSFVAPRSAETEGETSAVTNPVTDAAVTTDGAVVDPA